MLGHAQDEAPRRSREGEKESSRRTAHIAPLAPFRVCVAARHEARTSDGRIWRARAAARCVGTARHGKAVACAGEVLALPAAQPLPLGRGTRRVTPP
jgi:hypothetical protein